MLVDVDVLLMLGMIGIKTSDRLNDALELVLDVDVLAVPVVGDEVDAPEHGTVPAGALDEREPRIELAELLTYYVGGLHVGCCWSGKFTLDGG